MQKNRIEIAGNLSAKPDRRFLPSGTKVANARLAENHSYRDKENKLITQTNWHGLVFYDELADVAATYEKGDNLFVEGTVEQRKFTPKDGIERTVHEVIVRSCHLIAAPRSHQSKPTDTKPSQAGEAGPRTVEHGVNDESWPVSAA
jgi:single-strand DNA-binding protein